MQEDLKRQLRKGRPWTNPSRGNQDRGLIFVHGFGADPLDYSGRVEFLIESINPLAVLPFSWGVEPRWLTLGHRVPLLSKVFSRALTTEDPDKIVDSLVKELRDFLRVFGSAKLTLVGHSMGSVFLRAAYLELDPKERERVDGMLFLAPTSRGYLADDLLKKTELYLAERIPWCCAVGFSIAIGLFGYWAVDKATVPWSAMLLFISVLLLLVGRLYQPFTVFHLLRGAAWITGIRLKWIDLIAAGDTPRTASLRGAEDSLIGDYDDMESAQDVNAADQQILKNVNHHHFKLTPVTESHRRSLDKVKDDLKKAIEAALSWITDSTKPSGKCGPVSKTPRVFLIHGIRDFADWHEPLGYAIERSFATRSASDAAEAAKIVSITYGYFSAFQFLLPGERIRCSRVFRDRYVFERAQAPEADFYAFAHSNGTFVLGHVIEKTDGIRLTSVVLAGSVLNRDFDWPKYAGDYRVGSASSISQGQAPVVNFRASKDWPVGFLCRGLSGMGPNLPWLLPLLAALGVLVAWCFGIGSPCSIGRAFADVLYSANLWEWTFRALVLLTAGFLFYFVGVPYRNIGPAGVDGFLHRTTIQGGQVVVEPDVLDGGHAAALQAGFHSLVGDHFANKAPLVNGRSAWPKRDGAYLSNLLWTCLCRCNGTAVFILAALILLAAVAFLGVLIWASPTVVWAIVLSAALTFIVVRSLQYA